MFRALRPNRLAVDLTPAALFFLVPFAGVWPERKVSDVALRLLFDGRAGPPRQGKS